MTDTLIQTDLNLTFKWEIHNFLDRKETKNTSIVSPKFSVCDLANVSGDCVLAIYPRGEVDNSTGEVDDKESVNIFVKNISDKNLILFYTISIIDRCGLIREEMCALNQMDFSPGEACGFKNYITRDKLIDLLSVKGTLTIKLEIIKPGPNCPVAWLKDDLQKSFADMKFPDRQIICNGEKFDCHRFVLASRSPYFDAMFSRGFKESTSAEITIDSIQPNIMKEMLCFIYCGQTKDLKANAVDLLKAADLFQLENLKEVCGYHLSEKLDENNCLDYLVLGDKYSEEYLKDTALGYVVLRIKTLRLTDQWKEMKIDHPNIMMEVMEKVIDERDA